MIKDEKTGKDNEEEKKKKVDEIEKKKKWTLKVTEWDQERKLNCLGCEL